MGMVAGSPGLRPVIRFRARDWARQASPLHVFGGHPLLGSPLPVSAEAGRPLHLTFDFDLSDPRLRDLGIRSVDRLAILTNYHVDGSAGPLVVRYSQRGRRLELLSEPAGDLLPGAPAELPQLPVELDDLSPAEAAVETVDDLPEGGGPLHRIGGRPIWAQGPAPAPRCPETGKSMRFVAAVDSMLRFPLGGSETQLVFEDLGLLYVFWSDSAGISASFTQSR